MVDPARPIDPAEDHSRRAEPAGSVLNHVYDFDRQPAPDSDFVPGELRHLLPGNAARLLDARRTPVTVTGLALERCGFEVQIDAFEDAGATWELSLEDIGRFQFTRSAKTVEAATLTALEAARERARERSTIEVTPQARLAAEERLQAERSAARDWLVARGPLRIDLAQAIGARRGDARACELLGEFMSERGLDTLEEEFSAGYARNPASREVAKGHAVVLAEIGLCSYTGPAVRDPHLYDGERSQTRRADHVFSRLAFVHELFSGAGIESVRLYRGASADGPLAPRSPGSFVSTTFSRAVADEHFQGGPSTRTGVLWRQDTPVRRLFMTFIETSALNDRFREAEAVLLGDPSSNAF